MDQTYEQIISDCKNAVDLLPAKAEYNEEEKGRACKDAALAMLADIYLTLAPNHTSYYEDVVELCNEITNLGYDLSTCKYENNFDATINNGPESTAGISLRRNL